MKSPIRKIIYCLFIILFALSCSEDLVDMPKTGTLKGIVVKRGSNIPLANVKVYTSPTTQTVLTKADGTFSIEKIPLGDYSVRAELSGYITKLQGINMKSESQEVSVVLEMEDDNSLNSPPSVPLLISPADNTVGQPLEVNLSWESTDPDKSDSLKLKFRLIVKNSKDANIIEVKDIKQKSYTLKDLKFGVNYFWQIAASDDINPEVLSPVFQFKTNDTPPNRFHYVKKNNGNYYIVSSDEANVNFPFSEAAYNSWRPRKNNDAGVIAFLRTLAGNTHIFTAKPDGSGIFQVTSIPVAGFNAFELDFAWSKNGKEILYPHFDKLYRINKDGSGLQLVYTTTDGSLISECDWSYDGSKIAIKTNNLSGYNAKIFIIDMAGNVIKNVINNVFGALGGLNFSIDGQSLLYTHDISGNQDSDYRQLNTHIFIYNLSDDTSRDISTASSKLLGSLDLDPRFAPNEAAIIFVNTSNDMISPKNIMRVSLENGTNGNLVRTNLFSNAEMPDWE